MTRAGRRRRSVRASVLALAVAALAAGCFEDGPQVSVPPTPTDEPEPTPEVTVYDLDTRVWYAGMVVALDTATATTDEAGGTVVLELTLENHGDEEAELGGPIRLTGTNQGFEPTRETELPFVPADGSAAATVTFDIEGAFDLAGAVIRIGRSDEHQAIVPLVEGAQEAITLEPFGKDLERSGNAGDLYLDLEHLELRADLPDWDLELARDVMALTIEYGATFRGDFIGGMDFTSANIQLELPSGELVGPRRDGRSQVVAILRPSRRNHLSTRFEVPSPGTGAYALVFNDGKTQKELPFEIP